MAFCITFGSHDFRSSLQEYQGVQAQCRNCGNWQTQCVSRWPWFTVCFIPVIPLATHKYKEVACATCNFHQDLKNRPDIRPRDQGGLQQGPASGQPHQGWGPDGPPGHPLGPPGPTAGQSGGYYASGGQGGQPQYK